MSDLTDFLLACIDEDERTSWSASEERLWLVSVADDRIIADAGHMQQFMPSRVLAECWAKRRIIEFHRYSHECSSIDRYGEEDNCAWILESEDCSTVRLLGLPYADRPGYREEWKP